MNPVGEEILSSIFLNGWEIKAVCGKFLEYCHLALWDDHILMDFFLDGLDNNIDLLMPAGDSSVTLAQYMDILLWLCERITLPLSCSPPSPLPPS